MEDSDEWDQNIKSFIPYGQRDSTIAVPIYNSKSSLHYPYKLTISRIEGVTLPPIITEPYLNSSSDLPLSCQIRATFFDVNSACFYGRTWTSPRRIQIRRSKHKTHTRGEDAGAADDTADGDDEDEDASEESYDEHDKRIYSADVALVGNRLTAALHDVVRYKMLLWFGRRIAQRTIWI